MYKINEKLAGLSTLKARRFFKKGDVIRWRHETFWQSMIFYLEKKARNLWPPYQRECGFYDPLHQRGFGISMTPPPYRRGVESTTPPLISIHPGDNYWYTPKGFWARLTKSIFCPSLPWGPPKIGCFFWLCDRWKLSTLSTNHANDVQVQVWT